MGAGPLTNRRRVGRRVRIGVLAGVSALTLSGCALPGMLRGEPSVSAPPSLAPTEKVPADAEPLARFYNQQLTWADCEGAQCAKLTVPIDYTKPEGATIGVSVLKVAAKRPGNRIGSLVVNPGGPGASGVEYARYADFIVGSSVRSAYDIVGFDPRGVGESAPIDCLTDRELDGFLGQDPTPDTPDEEATAVENATAFGAGCEEKSGDLLPFVSTRDAARDMDILRAALGDAKLNYLGKSYGTYLGATYAGEFPKRVGRMVLDGVLAPDLSAEEMSLGQATGFERATRAWAQDCASDDCPLGSTADEVMAGLAAELTKLDATPARVSGDPRVTKLTEGWAAYGIASAMYDQGSWGILTDALRPLVARGDGTALMGLANGYADRNGSGNYTSNMMEAINAVNCLDLPDTDDLSVYEQRAESFDAQASIFGRFLAWAGLTCGYWPIESTHRPAPISAEGSEPIVVVGTTRDPATPYEWSVRLDEQLANGVLITFEGDGHTAYTRSNACVDDAIDAYYVSGTPPKDGLRC